MQKTYYSKTGNFYVLSNKQGENPIRNKKTGERILKSEGFTQCSNLNFWKKSTDKADSYAHWNGTSKLWYLENTRVLPDFEN